MAFKLKKLNHSPAWYREHCNGEDGGSAAFRAMLKTDMAFIGADNDSNLLYEEKIGPYEEKWNEIMSKGEILHESGGRAFRSDAKKSEMLAVIERESLAGFRPSDQFKDEPFKTIDELMTEAGLDEKTMREFLRWRSREGNTAEIEVVPVVEPAGKKEAREKIRQAKNRNPFFG
jgi:hypothetical protein